MKVPKTEAAAQNDGSIPVGNYVIKITSVDNKPSAKGDPMLTLETQILCDTDRKDVSPDGVVFGGRRASNKYLSFGEKAAPYACRDLLSMGITQEELDQFNDTEDEEWIKTHLLERCFVALLTNEVRYMASDGKSYTTDGLEAVNKKLPAEARVSFVKNGTAMVPMGTNYNIAKIIGPATKDGNPY